jgi:hypothetical protein
VIGNTFNEVMGYPKTQFADTYYYPWYEHNGTNMVTWILIGNPSDTDPLEVDIYIAGEFQEHDVIPAKQSISPTFNKNTGPLEVRSTNGKTFFTSERILYKPNVLNAFNETFGIPSNRLDTSYYFTWYDAITMSTDIIVAKP